MFVNCGSCLADSPFTNSDGDNNSCTNSYWNGFQDWLYSDNLIVAHYYNGTQSVYQNMNPCLPPDGWNVLNAKEEPFVIAEPILPMRTSKQEFPERRVVEPPSKASLFLWISVLFLVAATIVIFPILAISKMHSVSSTTMNFVRRYSGKMLITEGSLLKFDGLLLQRNTDTFAIHASKFQRAVDSIFMRSVYNKKYAGSEVSQFKFLPKIPALEVSFIIKTGRDLEFDAYDLTLMLRKHISMHGFDGNSIDENSITIVDIQ